VDIVLCADDSWAGVRMEVNVDTVDVALCWSMIRVRSMMRVRFEEENNSAKRDWSKFSGKLSFMKQSRVYGD
jgi:hypothetical protein